MLPRVVPSPKIGCWLPKAVPAGLWPGELLGPGAIQLTPNSFLCAGLLKRYLLQPFETWLFPPT